MQLCKEDEYISWYVALKWIPIDYHHSIHIEFGVLIWIINVLHNHDGTTCFRNIDDA